MSGVVRFIPDLPVDQVIVSGVFRNHLGDVSELAESIIQLGLLSPLVVTKDWLVVCGTRRLAAVKTLGWQTVPVWVASGVSDRLTRVLAMRDSDRLHKQLTPIEQAELYAELEQLYVAEAQRRKQCLTNDADSHENDAVSLVGVDRKAVRVEAARAVTGTDSHLRLDQINQLKTIAGDKTEHPLVRQSAVDALLALNQDGVVAPRWQQVKLHQATATIERAALDPHESDEVHQAAFIAAEAIDKQPSTKDKLREAKHAVTQITQTRRAVQKTMPPPDLDAANRRAVRQLVDLLRREHGWWNQHPPEVFARFAEGEQWELVTCYIRNAVQWLTQAESNRTQ